MKRLIYQVAVGEQSNLYKACIASVSAYAERMGFDHIVQDEPILRIRPDMDLSGRSKESVERLGYLPIFEKENAFDYFDRYDQIAIIDADVYIRWGCIENIFSELKGRHFAAAVEANQPLTKAHREKLLVYSNMQYSKISKCVRWEGRTALFRNMGVMVIDKAIAHRVGTAREFLSRPEFKCFIDGMSHWKWSTDQTLLNFWLHRDNICTSDMSWKWNALYTAVKDNELPRAHAVHFFLKDKLPERGENVQALLNSIGEV